MSDGPALAPTPQPAGVEALLSCRFDIAPGTGPDGKPAVLLTLSSPGCHMAVLLSPPNADTIAQELTRASTTARSGLVVPPPGSVPPNGQRRL